MQLSLVNNYNIVTNCRILFFANFFQFLHVVTWFYV